jgi:hypothetical protein
VVVVNHGRERWGEVDLDLDGRSVHGGMLIGMYLISAVPGSSLIVSMR